MGLLHSRAVSFVARSQNCPYSRLPSLKAVVAGPAGRRAPDHFFGRVCFPPCPFSRFGSFFFVLTSDFQFIDALINNARCACHP